VGAASLDCLNLHNAPSFPALECDQYNYPT
jgi:hypothetical protein